MIPNNECFFERQFLVFLKHNQESYQCYYHDTIYRKNEHHRETEKYEIGVESIGLNGVKHDCEILELCMLAMSSLGIKNYRIDVNHASFFDSIEDSTLIALNKRNYTKLSTYPKQGKEDILRSDSPLKDFAKEMKKRNQFDTIYFNEALTNKTGYYSGIFFECSVENYHKPIVTGGRYDTLLSHFGVSKPAIGFAMDINAIEEIIASC